MFNRDSSQRLFLKSALAIAIAASANTTVAQTNGDDQLIEECCYHWYS